jgi:hypothetical protein
MELVRWKQGCCVSSSTVSPVGFSFESQSNLGETCRRFP